jgi:tripartite-type tricarboxylate transporter receptor subunit TctC
MKRLALLAAIAALHLCSTALPAAAQNYPSRPIRVIVPFEASGAMDVVMRIVGKKVSDSGAAQIVIENKTGAGGVIGVMAVKDATPDGYMLAEVEQQHACAQPAHHRGHSLRSGEGLHAGDTAGARADAARRSGKLACEFGR